ADLRQLSERVYLSPAPRIVSAEPPLVGLPGMQGTDRVLRQHPRTQLAAPAWTLPTVQRADFAALPDGRSPERGSLPGLRLVLRLDSRHAEILHARFPASWPDFYRRGNEASSRPDDVDRPG